MTAQRGVPQLVADLDREREAFSAALAGADPELLSAPGLVGDWSARELVAHLAYWCDWGATCLDGAAAGRLAETAATRLAELGHDGWDVDAQNASVAHEARAVPMSAVLDREARAYERLRDRLATLDASLLAVEAPWGETVERIVRENGPDHYAEHAEHVRAWFSVDPEDSDAADDQA